MKKGLLNRLALTIFVSAGISSVYAEDMQRSLKNVKGDVYIFEDSNNEWKTPHGAMVVITNEGVIVSDPLSKDASNWLREKISDQFNKPITHMIYSHAHHGHNSGGEAFGNDIEVIAHNRTKTHIENGMTKTALPTNTFTENYTFKAGNKTIEAYHLGDKGHSDDLVAYIVRPENIAFVVDLATPKRLPLANFPETDIDGFIEQLKAVEALEFELLLPGHGPIGTKADISEQRTYIELLRASVKRELDAGKTTDEIIKKIKMEDYKDWYQYEAWLELNIRGMIDWLKK